MGTTESIFADEEPQNVVSPPTIDQRHSPRDDGTYKNAQTQSPKLNPQQQQLGAKRSSKRASNKPICRMEGLVVGGALTGKHSLLQRLEGKDPFAKGEKKADNDGSGQKKKSEILIPYKPPPKTRLPDRILLHIQSSLPSSDVQERPTNFVVILINPLRDWEDIKTYTLQIIVHLLAVWGYRPNEQQQQQQREPRNNEEIKSDDDLPQKHPICICFLFNFRDAVEEHTIRSPDIKLPQLSEFKNLVQVIFDKIIPRNIQERNCVLSFGSTSMRNCYGLNILHHFIYRCYLLRKKIDLERQLYAINEAQRRAPLLEPTIASYKEFLNIVESPSNDDEEPVMESTAKVEGSENTQNLPDKRKGKTKKSATPDSAPLPRPEREPKETSSAQIRSRQAETKEPVRLSQRGPNGSTRRVYGAKEPVRVGMDALEAFLASDDEEEDQKRMSKKEKKKKKKRNREQSKKQALMQTSSDDDDDDFFFDESGQRHDHLVEASSGDSSDSSISDSDVETEVLPSQTSAIRGSAGPPARTATNSREISVAPPTTPSGDRRQVSKPVNSEKDIDGVNSHAHEDSSSDTARCVAVSHEDNDGIQTHRANSGAESEGDHSVQNTDVLRHPHETSSISADRGDSLENDTNSKVRLRSADQSDTAKSAQEIKPIQSNPVDTAKRRASEDTSTGAKGESNPRDETGVEDMSSEENDSHQSPRVSKIEEPRKYVSEHSHEVKTKAPQVPVQGSQDDSDEFFIGGDVSDKQSQHVLDSTSKSPPAQEKGKEEIYVVGGEKGRLDNADDRSVPSAPTEMPQQQLQGSVSKASPIVDDDSDEDEFFIEATDSLQEADGVPTHEKNEKEEMPSSSHGESEYRTSSQSNNVSQNVDDSLDDDVEATSDKSQTDQSPGKYANKTFTGSPAPGSQPTKAPTDDDSDTEFFIDDDKGQLHPTIPAAAKPQVPVSPQMSDTSNDPTIDTKPPPPSSGISAAALAAIAAAQQEAEAMLADEINQGRSSGERPKKEKKKKKDKDGSKKKKKKKEKRSKAED